MVWFFTMKSSEWYLLPHTNTRTTFVRKGGSAFHEGPVFSPACTAAEMDAHRK